MTIIWKDTTLKLHGKRHKNDRYYFRWHYGKQRMVHVVTEYVDKPTEAQKNAREAFTELRKEVARQLHDPILRARWEARFKKDPQGYKMLHTYVYAMMKAGETIACRDAQKSVVSTSGAVRGGQPNITLLVVKDVIVPIFLPSKVPRPISIRMG